MSRADEIGRAQCINGNDSLVKNQCLIDYVLTFHAKSWKVLPEGGLMFIWIPRKQLDKWRIAMSDFSDKMATLTATIAAGHVNDAEVKAALEEVKTELAANTASDAEVKATVVALAEALAAAPPTPTP